MATTPRDLLITALKNAYGLEGQAQTSYQAHADSIEEFPQYKAHMQTMARSASEHQKRLEECLNHLGESPSSFKEQVMKAAGSVQSAIHNMHGDTVLKNYFTDVGLVNFERAAYKSLVAMAETCNEPQVSETVQHILDEEQQAAQWLDDNVKPITEYYLRRVASPETASA